MIAAWMLYAAIVAALLSLAALTLECVLRLVGRPTRWAWVASLASSLLVPLGAWLVGPPSLQPPDVPVPMFDVQAIAWAGEALPLMGESRPTLEALNRPLLLGWGGASAMLLLFLLTVGEVLRRRCRSWLPDMIAGVSVLVSRDTGPAVVGLVRSRIVVPAWVRRLDPVSRSLIVEHEAEHLRAGDPRLLLGGLAMLVLLPWNLPLWWQVRRLRFALEADCDARVLRRWTDVATYGTLLLEVGRRTTRSSLTVAALSEPRSFLERRIRIMTSPRPIRPWFHAAGFTVLAAALAGASCAVHQPDPPRPVTESPGPPTHAGSLPSARSVAVPDDVGKANPAALRVAAASQEAATISERVVAQSREVAEASKWVAATPRSVSAAPVFRTEPSDTPPPGPPGDPSQRPTFTPFEVAPEMANRVELVQAIRAHYPAELREAGIGGTVKVWVFIDENGTVQSTRVVESSGRPALDRSAEAAMRVARFKPAINRDQKVPVWVQFPITFQPDAGGPAKRDGGQGSPPPLPGEPSAATIEAAIRRHHPGVLAEGSGADAIVWFIADGEGNVSGTGIESASEEQLVRMLRARYPEAPTEFGFFKQVETTEGSRIRVAWFIPPPQTP